MHRIHRNDRWGISSHRLHRFSQIRRVSVQSVGEYPPPEASVNSVNSVGGLAQTNLEWVLWKEFGGRRGYGRDAIPSYFCENLCNLWENILRQKLL